MLFSYGFLEERMDKAETLFLSLSIPENDRSRAAKMKVAECAPGFKIIDVSEQTSHTSYHQGESSSEQMDGDDTESRPSGDIDWTGDFVWFLCITDEDGLHFQIARTVEGEEELQATFDGHELKGGAGHLRRLLMQTPLWPVYRLRAVVLLQQRVFDQLQVLYQSQDDLEKVPHGDGTEVREAPYQQAMKLRRLEFELLERTYEDFERQVSKFSLRISWSWLWWQGTFGCVSNRVGHNQSFIRLTQSSQKMELADSPIVQHYLADMNREQQTEDDFS